jgi:hypothetical protein
MTAVFHPHPAPEISGGRGSTPGIPQWLTEKIDNPAKLTKDEVDAKIKEANIASRIKAEQLRFRKTTTEDITARYDLQFVYIRHREPGWTGMKFDGESSELEFIPGRSFPKVAWSSPTSCRRQVIRWSRFPPRSATTPTSSTGLWASTWLRRTSMTAARSRSSSRKVSATPSNSGTCLSFWSENGIRKIQGHV